MPREGTADLLAYFDINASCRCPRGEGFRLALAQSCRPSNSCNTCHQCETQFHCKGKCCPKRITHRCTLVPLQCRNMEELLFCGPFCAGTHSISTASIGLTLMVPLATQVCQQGTEPTRQALLFKWEPGAQMLVEQGLPVRARSLITR